MNSPFVVYPAKVVGGILNPVYPPNPAQTIHFGVPLTLFTSPGDLLRLEIVAWDQQAANDSGWLIINKGNPIFMKTIQPGEEGKPFFYDVPKAYFNNGINIVVVQARNSVQPGGTDSIDLLTLVYIPRPGGEVAGPGANPNLTFTVSHTNVGPTEAANGVDVRMRYIHMRIGDVATLYLDGGLKTQTVTATDLQLGYVQIKLFAPDFAQDNNKFELRYRVETSLGDSSGPQAIWSAPTYINVHVKQPPLDLLMPKVLEARDSNGTVINFVRDFYSVQNATVQVAYTGSDRGQTVKVYWQGRNWTYGSEIQTVASAGETLTFLVPRHAVVDCISTNARVWYTVATPSDPAEKPSRDLGLSVTGQKYQLPEPTLNGSKTNLRTYFPALDGRYSVRISLTVDNVRQDSAEFPITTTSYQDIVVPPQWISSNRGKLGLFNYTLHKTGTSEPHIFSWYLRVIL
ncbi:hypothetical protein [Pseudomonas sp. COW5]|uniref:hypothetical protein n=1 Tax=Pseudomonas sp. COW5 TaxID=2981253 RepID=UPI002246731D|nr:hypothetical protein [Pseudomonas sp. COW5]MCX2546470.1 hypothetical protein [Pseudomonas sp. COW5]